MAKHSAAIIMNNNNIKHERHILAVIFYAETFINLKFRSGDVYNTFINNIGL